MTVLAPIRPFRSVSHGLSLIEILVALAIAALLLLGLSQIFLGSKAAYSIQQGMSRSQENARFVFSYLEDNLRMAGYYGCGNEADSSLQFFNHIPGAGVPDPTGRVRFQRPIQGFEYTNCTTTSCATDNLDPAAAVAGDFTPPLNAANSDVLASATVKGSDVLILRVLSAKSTPALGAFDPTTGTFTVAAVPNEPNFVKAGEVYAATNCRPRVDIFRASGGSAGTTLIAGPVENQLRGGSVANDTWGFTNAQGEFQQPPLGTPAGTLNAEIHKAEYLAIFVGLDTNGNPALKVRHYDGTAGEVLPQLTTEEIVDGVESMHLTYGVDNNGDGLADDPFVKASDIQPAALADPVAIDAAWRKVVSVRVALLMRSQDRASATAKTGGNVFNVADAKLTRPSDGRFRDVYETTIALRNRLTSF
ncbi:PilW family protein [Dokdonella soli]|uniref:PilW family protein n=1 Tax=Dokdonella soli TaxID=529810 RepID=A0ABN1IBV5_9GAMM